MRTFFYLLNFVTAFSFFIFFHNSLHAQNSNKTDTTIIRREFDDNEKDEEIIRQHYFQNMHRAAPGIDWRNIEMKNNLVIYQQAQFVKFTPGSYANGSL